MAKAPPYSNSGTLILRPGDGTDDVLGTAAHQEFRFQSWLQFQTNEERIIAKTERLLERMDEEPKEYIVTGDSFTIRAQDVTGFSATGGDLVLRGGSGA